MKHLLTLVAAVCAVSAAQATGSPAPAPAPTSAAPITSTSDAAAQAAAAALAGARSDAAGGAAEQQQKAAASSALTSADNSTARALALSFFVQPPAFTPPMAQVQCASASVKQEASSTWIVLGGHSSATSTTDASDCTLLNIRNAMVKECKYASAKLVEDLLVQKHLPKFQPTGQAYTKSQDDPGFVDYTPTQCGVLLAPPPPPPPLVSIEPLLPKAEPVAPKVVPKKPVKRRPVPPCVNVCQKKDTK
jgi:hypothetical protein